MKALPVFRTSYLILLTSPSGIWPRLRAVGLGERVLKTTLAVVLAWEIGTLVPGGTAHPYFAPLAALLSFQITVADSIVSAAQRVAGIVAGVAVALLLSHLVGDTVWGVGLLVLLSLVVGVNLHLTPQGVSQVATSALIVMFVGQSGSIEYAGSRIVDSLVGAVTGVAVNALLVPPSYLPGARSALQAFAGAITAVLDQLATSLEEGLAPTAARGYLEQARALAKPAAAARAALQRAETSLKYNLLRRGEQADLAAVHRQVAVLEQVALHVRSLARALADSVEPTTTIATTTTTFPREPGSEGSRTNTVWRPGPLPAALGRLLCGLSATVFAFAGQQTPASPSELEQQHAEIDRLRAEVDRAARSLTPALPPETWMDLGVLLEGADRIRLDLSASPAKDGEQLEPAAPERRHTLA